MGEDNVSLSLDEIIKKERKGGKGKIFRNKGGKFVRGGGGAGRKFAGGRFKGKKGGKRQGVGLRTKGAAVMKGRGKFRSDNFNTRPLKRLGGRGKNNKNKLLPGGANATSGGRIRAGRNGLFTSAKSRRGRGGIVGGNNLMAIRGRSIQNQRRQNFKSAFTGYLQSGQRQRPNNLVANRQQNPFFQSRSEGIFSSVGLGSRRGQNNQLRAVAQRKINRARLILLKRNINRALRENVNSPQQQQQQQRFYMNRGGGRVGRFTGGRVPNQRVAQNIQSKINRARMARDSNRGRLIDDLPTWRSQPAGPSTLIRSSQLQSYNYDYSPPRRPVYPMKNLAIRTINEHARVREQPQYNYNSPMTRTLINENRQPEDEMTRPSLDPEIQRTISYLQSRGGASSSQRIAPDYKASTLSTHLKLSDRFKHY